MPLTLLLLPLLAAAQNAVSLQVGLNGAALRTVENVEIGERIYETTGASKPALGGQVAATFHHVVHSKVALQYQLRYQRNHTTAEWSLSLPETYNIPGYLGTESLTFDYVGMSIKPGYRIVRDNFILTPSLGVGLDYLIAAQGKIRAFYSNSTVGSITQTIDLSEQPFRRLTPEFSGELEAAFRVDDTMFITSAFGLAYKNIYSEATELGTDRMNMYVPYFNIGVRNVLKAR